MRPALYFLLILSIGVLTIAGTGCSSGTTAASPVPSDTDKAEAVVSLKVILPQRTTLKRTTTQPATVHPNYQAKIYAKVTGYLQQFHADIGQKVKKNDVLAVLSVPEMEKAIESQQKTLERLGAEEDRAKTFVELARANVEAARAAVEQARAEVAKADAQVAADSAEHTRIGELVSSKSVADRLLDEVSKKCASSQAAKAAAQAGVLMANAQLHVSEAKLKTAQADLQIAQVEIEVACKKLDELDTMNAYAKLRAPFDGVVTQRHIDLGDLVRTTETASRQPLFTIAQTDTVRVRVMVPEKDAPLVNEGDVAVLKMQSLPGRTFEGKVSRISGSLDESTRTMLVEIDLPNNQGELLPGMFGEATIVLEEKKDAVVLPAKAVRHDEQGRSFVYVVSADNVLRKTEVTLGLDNGTDLEIVSPLEGSERIVDATLATLKDGQHVAVQ